MNRYSPWKYILIILVLLIGIVYALPNIYGEDPALQVTDARAAPIEPAFVETITTALDKAGIAYKSVESDEQQFLIRFHDTGSQLEAVDYVKATAGSGYVVALNLAPATPEWLQSINALPMYLGLDLRGGVHFLMEVDMDAAVNKTLEGYASEFKAKLRKAKIRYTLVRAESDGIRLMFRSTEDRDSADALISKDLPELTIRQIDSDDGKAGLMVTPNENEINEIRKLALQQNILTLRNRVNELGVAEPVIQQQGAGRIVVQLPGVQDTARAKRILGATATLEYRAVDFEHDVETAVAGRVPAGSKIYYERNGAPVLLKKGVIVTGDQIINARSGFDSQSGSPNVTVMLDSKGARRMLEFTKQSVGKPMAVVFIENKTEIELIDGKPVRKVIVVQGKLVNIVI